MMGMTMPSAVVTIIKGTYLPLFTDETDPREWTSVQPNIQSADSGITSL